MMQISVEHELLIHQMDVKTAYSNAPLNCEVYIIPPKGCSDDRGIWKLNEPLWVKTNLEKLE